MLEELRCPLPGCRAPLDDFNVVGDMGYCPKCGKCFRVTGGTLALTNDYGLDLPDLKKNRVEADLAAQNDYLRLCRGKLEDCKQRLEWGAEKYASLPPQPELLEVRKYDYGKWIAQAFYAVGIMSLPMLCGYVVSCSFYHLREASGTGEFFGHWPAYNPLENPLLRFLFVVLCGWLLLVFLLGLIDFLIIGVANGTRPEENARRQRKYERDLQAAMKDAERVKEGEDYRIKENIRKLTGTIEAVREKAESIRSDYAERARRSQINRY